MLTMILNNLSAPKSGPRNLQVYNATSNSLTVKWDPASGRVQKYRITYQPSTGEGSEQTVICFVKTVTWTNSTLSSSNFFHPQYLVSYTYYFERCKICSIGWKYLTPSMIETQWTFSWETRVAFHSSLTAPDMCLSASTFPLKTIRVGLFMNISRFLSLFRFSIPILMKC